MAGSHRYSDSELEQIRGIPIEEVLRDFGEDTSHTRGGLYYSPFHKENTPSFHIDRTKNRWFEWGSRSSENQNGGDVIAFVMRYQGIEFGAACEYLASKRPELSILHESTVIGDTGGYSHSGTVRRVIDRTLPRFQSAVLLNYAQGERHIPASLLNRYCKEVHYSDHYENGEHSNRFAIGFPNIHGDWALRWPSKDPKRGKISTGQNFTVISPDGSFMSEDDLNAPNHGRGSSNVVVFEGFMDFLSWLAWNGVETPGRADAVVLNSVTNAKKALDFLAAHDRVVAYLDTDEAGESYTSLIADEMARRSCEDRQIEVRDGRYAFRDRGGDVNEAWVKVHRARQLRELERQEQQKREQQAAERKAERAASSEVRLK